MPNYVTSRCTITGPADQIEAFRQRSFKQSDSGENYLDFGAFIPMPLLLQGSEASSVAERGLALIVWRGSSCAPYEDHAVWWMKHVRAELEMPDKGISDVARAYLAAHPDYEAAGMARLRALIETGYGDWYPWAIEKWGTKWNSFRLAVVDDQPFSFRFETAWSFPVPVFEEIARQYPDLTFACACHDEGDNFGGRGAFNPGGGDQPFAIVDATDELYEAAHGHPRPSYDEDKTQ